MITHMLSLRTAVDDVPFTPCSKKKKPKHILYTAKLLQKPTLAIPVQLVMKIKHNTQFEGRIRQRTKTRVRKEQQSLQRQW